VLSEECTEPPEPDGAREGRIELRGDSPRGDSPRGDSPDYCNQVILTRSAAKATRKEKRSLRKAEGRKSKKEVKRLKKTRKEETQTSPIPSAAEEEKKAEGETAAEGEKVASTKDE
jgi:hypothetical protein